MKGRFSWWPWSNLLKASKANRDFHSQLNAYFIWKLSHAQVVWFAHPWRAICSRLLSEGMLISALIRPRAAHSQRHQIRPEATYFTVCALTQSSPWKFTKNFFMFWILFMLFQAARCFDAGLYPGPSKYLHTFSTTIKGPVITSFVVSQQKKCKSSPIGTDVWKGAFINPHTHSELSEWEKTKYHVSQ